jgi:hypothetical protein
VLARFVKGVPFVIALAACACTRAHAAPAGSNVQASGSDALATTPDAGEERLQPLTNAPWLDRLDLPGGEAAFVSVPLGAREARPIMIASHGAGDRPEWACGSWRGVTNAYPFIICPRGTPTGDGRYYWRSTRDLGRVVDLAIVALRERFGAYVAEGPMLYAGFSAGAIYGALLVRDRASEFPIAVLSEGGYDQVADPAFATRFKANGGRRVLFGCSTGPGCVRRLGRAKAQLERAGIEVRINDAGPVGHSLVDAVVRSLRGDMPWVVGGVPPRALPG